MWVRRVSVQGPHAPLTMLRLNLLMEAPAGPGWDDRIAQLEFSDSVVARTLSTSEREPGAEICCNLLHRGPVHACVAADVIDQAFEH